MQQQEKPDNRPVGAPAQWLGNGRVTSAPEIVRKVSSEHVRQKVE
jgi:hypothetical protein